ncbi:hypothetical protein ABIA33_003420 [Streptacidiphilus sp. MAP12-16]|uniref:hypothetical protein n=1 Tax=Streptacidiphilus sp. MAP12-16 TaxID=3156300 RepID=UPI0035147D90
MDDHRGVATGPPEELRTRVLSAWDALLALADSAGRQDLALLAELGSWPERPVLARLMAQARSGLPGSDPGPERGPGRGPEGSPERAPEPPRQDHAGEDREAVLAALAGARQRVAAALDEVAEQPALALVELDSALGPLPLLTQIHAMGHELALAALRCSEGPAAVPVAITDAGVAALVDVVGALAHRQGVRASAGVWGSGTSGWVFTADGDGWRTTPGSSGVPGIEGAAATVLGVPAGRGALPSLLAKGEIRLHRIGGLMALAPLVEQVPGLPGGALLRRAVGVVGLLGRLPGIR